MLYLIGVGLNEKSISQQGLEAIKKCKKVYFENYTVDFPYEIKTLEKILKKKLIPADRNLVEGSSLIQEAKKENICLLIYGSPLTATTHISLIQDAKKKKVRYDIIYSSSVFDAIAETGLQIYKFGKIASMPKWSSSFKPTSFMGVIKQNQSIDAHSLILIDIGMDLKECIEELEISAREYDIELKEILVCSRLGTKESEIVYKKVEKLKSLKIKRPYCLIIPSKLHFLEQEILDKFN